MNTELRWFKKEDYESYGDDGLKHIKGETVLQERHPIYNGECMSDWEDIPLVFEVFED